MPKLPFLPTVKNSNYTLITSVATLSTNKPSGINLEFVCEHSKMSSNVLMSFWVNCSGNSQLCVTFSLKTHSYKYLRGSQLAVYRSVWLRRDSGQKNRCESFTFWWNSTQQLGPVFCKSSSEIQSKHLEVVFFVSCYGILSSNRYFPRQFFSFNLATKGSSIN